MRMTTLTAEASPKAPGTIRPRIDSLTPGQAVVLQYGTGTAAIREYALFVRIEGKGAGRRAVFADVERGEDGDAYVTEFGLIRRGDFWEMGPEGNALRVRIGTYLPPVQ